MNAARDPRPIAASVSGLHEAIRRADNIYEKLQALYSRVYDADPPLGNPSSAEQAVEHALMMDLDLAVDRLYGRLELFSQLINRFDERLFGSPELKVPNESFVGRTPR